jgi:endonuclease III
MICLPVGPRCSSCDLSGGICPSASKGNKKAKKEKIEMTTAFERLSSAVPLAADGPKVEIEIETEVKLEES